MERIIIALMLLVISYSTNSQNITGTVYEQHGSGKHIHLHPIVGAHVIIQGTNYGAITDENGKFGIKYPEQSEFILITSYVGYKSDTSLVNKTMNNISIILESLINLSEVEVQERKSAEYVSKLDPIKTEVITTSGLERLACCNLSESFENSGTVDVSYSDAVAGVKQIQMLGLAGIYAQIMSENMPMVKGLAYPFGITYVPGPWLESIQISRGTASVVNGYESTTGQINIEYKKPDRSERFFLNGYTNSMGKAEMNTWLSHRINEKISTMTLVHGSYFNRELDHNHDSFLDDPKTEQFNLLHRWTYEIPHKICNQYSLRINYDDKTAGQIKNTHNDGKYRAQIYNNQYNIAAKHGFHLERPLTSLGIQTQAGLHDLNTRFGNNKYIAEQKSAYINIIYQTYIYTTDHIINTGVSFMHDNYNQNFNDSIWDFSESVPGFFAQYTLHLNKRLQFIIGGRADYNSLHGILLTPRFHTKFDISEKTILRASFGKGYRSPLVIAENFGYMASSRQWIITNNINIEEAWNGGINMTHDFKLFKNNASFSIDIYRTEFINQVIADIQTDANKVLIYNLDGKSYSNSFQTNISINPLRGFEISTAFRYNDVKQTYMGVLEAKPLVSPYKILLSPSYSTKNNKWSFDNTIFWNSGGKNPRTDTKPKEYQLNNNYPDYFIIHAQITHRLKKVDIYTGVENLLNFKQKNPIIASHNPFGPDFDASLIWGPISGRMIYFGFRYRLDYN